MALGACSGPMDRSMRDSLPMAKFMDMDAKCMSTENITLECLNMENSMDKDSSKTSTDANTKVHG